MKVSIIIVNWNSIDFARDCIHSICANAHGLAHEVIVVDNASPDDCGVLTTETLTPVTVVRSPSNLGFAGANNLGYKRATGDRILFLNPDTLVLDDAIQKMAMAFDDHADLGAVGCRQLNRDYTLQTNCVQPFPSIFNQLFGLDWIQRRWPQWKPLGIRCLGADHDTGIHEVDTVSGACLMVRRDVFELVGGFSTEYFLYAEEADLCYRIRHMGWRVGHVSNARIVHFGGEASKHQSSNFSDIVMHESVFKLLRKFRGSTYAWAYRLALLLSATIRLTVLVPLVALPSAVVNRASTWRSIRKWHSIACWSVALEPWARDLGDARRLAKGSVTNT